jgi:hypothetical protein
LQYQRPDSLLKREFYSHVDPKFVVNAEKIISIITPEATFWQKRDLGLILTEQRPHLRSGAVAEVQCEM